MSEWERIKYLFIDNDLKIFPVEKNGKKPLIEKWQENCSSDYFQILYWYENCKGCNWGLPATPNNLFILDLDVHNEDKNGIESFERIKETLLDGDFHNSYTAQRTASGGKHIIYKTDDDLKQVANSSNVFIDYPGIDIRTDGYIVVEPSIINGCKYSFETNLDIHEMPLQLKKFILENANVTKKTEHQHYKKPSHVEVGDRDNQLFSYINNIYYKTSLDYDEILVLANYFNENILEKPFSKKDVRYKVNKVFEHDRCKYIFLKINED